MKTRYYFVLSFLYFLNCPQRENIDVFYFPNIKLDCNIELAPALRSSRLGVRREKMGGCCRHTGPVATLCAGKLAGDGSEGGGGGEGGSSVPPSLRGQRYPNWSWGGGHRTLTARPRG